MENSHMYQVLAIATDLYVIAFDEFPNGIVKFEIESGLFIDHLGNLTKGQLPVMAGIEDKDVSDDHDFDDDFDDDEDVAEPA